MKSILFMLLGLLFVSGSNNHIKSSSDPQTPAPECVLCDETPCKCQQLALKESDGKISLKKLIHVFLKKTSKSSNPEECQECRHCRHECPKNNIIANLLRNILKKSNCDKKEEDSIREIIVKLLDPSDCQKKPCQVHCDPKVQQVLKTILKKAVNCDCQDCPSNCHLNPKLCRQNPYKYWFKVSREAMRKEINNRQHSTNQNLCSPQEEETQSASFQKTDASKICNEMKSASEYCKRCKYCRRPDRYICPRYITNDCSTSGNNPFPICADCSHCSIYPRDSKNFVSLFCGNCRAIAWPYVQFTRNGYPFRQDFERQNGLLIRTRFLQINDFRSSDERKSIKTVYNPFQPKSNIPRKKGRCKA